MAPADNSGARPAGPVVLRIKLRYDDLDAMVQRFAPNVGKSGLFLPTKSIQPIGTEVKFELRLANDVAVLVGMGKVKYVKAPDPTQPRAAFGMAIELTRVSREGREVIIRMIERRRAMGLPDVAIPVPEDLEAARRSDLDTQPRVDTSGVVREAMAQFASVPVAEQVLTGSPTQTGPIGTVKDPTLTGAVPIIREPSGPIPVAAPAERHSSPLLTAPRPSRTTAEHKEVSSLAPEPARAKRPRVADLIARATESGPLASAIPELDEQVDIQHALARARVLAGGDLDAELSAVRESAAAPIEIGIEAASAELARQLGGKPIVKRDRSAGWATPPAIEMRHEAPVLPSSSEPSTPPSDPEFVAKTRAETEVAPSAVIATVTAAAIEAIEAAPVEAAPVEAMEAAPVDAMEAAPVEAAPLEAAPFEDAPISTRAPSEDAAPIDEAYVLESAPVEAIAASELAAIRDHEPPPPEGAALDDDEEAMELDSADLVPDDDDEPAAAAAEYDEDERTRGPAVDDAVGPYAGLQADVDEPAAAAAEYDEDERTRGPAVDDAVGQYAGVQADVDEPAAAAAEYDEDERTRGPVVDDAAAEFDRDLRTRVPSGDDEQRMPQPMLISDDANVADFERALDSAPEHLNSNELVLRDDDAEESTAIGRAPVGPNAFAAAAYSTMPDALADQLDQQLAEAEDEADSDLAIGMQEQPYDRYGQPAEGYDEQGMDRPYEASGDANEQGVYDAPGGAPEPAAAFQLDAEEDEGEEISDFDVLAEADEDDADLVNASAQSAPDFATPRYDRAEPEPETVPPERPSYDFAASLDLDDDVPAEQEFDEVHAGSHAPMRPQRRPSAGDFDAPSNSYTFAENPPSVSFPLPAQNLDESLNEALGPDDEVEDFDEPHGYAIPRHEAPQRPAPAPQQRYAAPAPQRPARAQRAVSEPQILRGGQNPDDLEDALAALDVDLDDLSLDEQRARRSGPSHRPSSTGQRPLPGLPIHRPSEHSRPIQTLPRTPTGQQQAIRQPSQQVPTVQPTTRASSEDGILIEFEDDE